MYHNRPRETSFYFPFSLVKMINPPALHTPPYLRRISLACHCSSLLLSHRRVTRPVYDYCRCVGNTVQNVRRRQIAVIFCTQRNRNCCTKSFIRPVSPRPPPPSLQGPTTQMTTNTTLLFTITTLPARWNDLRNSTNRVPYLPTCTTPGRTTPQKYHSMREGDDHYI